MPFISNNFNVALILVKGSFTQLLNLLSYIGIVRLQFCPFVVVVVVVDDDDDDGVLFHD